MDPKLRRHADPEDVLQQAYVAAFQSIKQCSFDGPAGFYKWLETIALDRLKDLKRDLGRKKRDIGRQLSAPPAATSSYADLVERLASPQSTPSRHLAKREACAAAVSSLARLTPDQRAVVRMRLLEGKQAAEVAAELGKSEAAVHMLLHRALKELRKLMVSITRYLSRL
jgi:RNA polymerase sigma-70 factor (ECF subfamily)